MMKKKGKIIKIIKRIAFAVFILLVGFFLVRAIGKAIYNKTPNNVTMEHITARNAIMQKYGYDMMVNGSDYNLVATIMFNPNYSITDWINYFKRDMSVYLDFFASEEFASFSLKDRIDYQVPFYNINGDKDYQTNYKLAQEYFDEVNAPYKQMYLMKNMTHAELFSMLNEWMVTTFDTEQKVVFPMEIIMVGRLLIERKISSSVMSLRKMVHLRL